VAFIHDGKRIVSGSADGTLKVWDTQTSQQLLMHGRDARRQERGGW